LQQKTMATLLDMQEEAIIDILLLFQINIKWKVELSSVVFMNFSLQIAAKLDLYATNLESFLFARTRFTSTFINLRNILKFSNIISST
jgi:hypothetical protein